MSDDIHELRSSDQHVPAGNPLLSFRVAPDLEAAIRACAAEVSIENKSPKFHRVTVALNSGLRELPQSQINGTQ